MNEAIQIRRAEVVADIRALAALTGTSLTAAVAAAVRSQLAVERAKANSKLARRKLEAELGLAEIRRLPVIGSDVGDEDLYDSSGMPR